VEDGRFSVLSGGLRCANPHYGLKRNGVTYAQFVERLSAIGVDEKEVNIRNKLARAKFSASFMVQCMSAVESTALRLED